MNEKEIRNQDGYHLYGWMVNILKLEGGDLIAFAIIYGFVKGNAGEYTGNTEYLSKWTGWTKKTSRAHLANLVQKGLIVEVRGRNKNQPYCHHRIAPDFYDRFSEVGKILPGKNYPHSREKITSIAGKKLPQKENVENKNVKTIYVKDNPPTEETIREYVAAKGVADPAGFAAYYINEMYKSGWTTKSGQPIRRWETNVDKWIENHKDEIFAASPVTPDANKTQINFLGR